MDATEDFSRGALPREAVQRLYERSNIKGLVHLAGHLAVIGATGYLVWRTRSTGWLVPAMWLHGTVIVFLFTALHECTHRTAFKSRWLNDAVGWFCGLAVVQPPNWYRYFHFAHHRHTQIEGQDPELRGKHVGTPNGYLWHVTALPYWSASLRGLVRNAVSERLVDDEFIAASARSRITRDARIFIAVYAVAGLISAVLLSDSVVVYWALPVLLGQPVLKAYQLAEHTGCAEVRDMFESSRTTRSLAFVRFLAWNMPYHTEHHAWPAVPFHALPELHRLIESRLVNTATGYVAFHRQWWKRIRRR